MNKIIGVGTIYLAILLVIVSCKTQVVSTQKSIEMANLQKGDSLRIWFDLGDPISYFLTYSGELKLTVYTHKMRRNLLIREDIVLTDSVNFNYFKKLGVLDLYECGAYNNYLCKGLDGSSVKLELRSDSGLINYEYWSPEDQLDTELGNKLIEIQNKIESDFSVIEIKDKFYGNLKKGRYWNLGEAILIK